MYAIFITGGKQYRAAEGETIFVEKLEGEAGNESNRHSIQNIVLLGNASGEYTETEKKVAYIYAGVLDIKEIDI